MQDKYAFIARRAWCLPALLSLIAPLAMPMVACALMEIELWRRRARDAISNMDAHEDDTLDMIDRSRAELSVLLFRAPFATLWIMLHLWRYGQFVFPLQASVLTYLLTKQGKYVLALMICILNIIVLMLHDQYARVPSDLVATLFLLPGTLLSIDEDPAILALVCLNVLSLYVMTF